MSSRVSLRAVVPRGQSGTGQNARSWRGVQPAPERENHSRARSGGAGFSVSPGAGAGGRVARRWHCPVLVQRGAAHLTANTPGEKRSFFSSFLRLPGKAQRLIECLKKHTMLAVAPGRALARLYQPMPQPLRRHCAKSVHTAGPCPAGWALGGWRSRSGVLRAYMDAPNKPSPHSLLPRR